MKKRSSSIQVLDGWLRKVEAEIADKYPSQTAFAEAIGYDQGTVSRFMRSNRGGIDLVDAIAMKLGLPKPWLVIKEQEERDWCELGVELRDLSPGQFSTTLELVRQTVMSARQIATSKQAFGPTPVEERSDPRGRNAGHGKPSDPTRPHPSRVGGARRSPSRGPS